MRVFDLCPDPADPRRTCQGRTCRCRGSFRLRTETTYRPPGPGEVEVWCRGCGATSVEVRQAVAVWTRCSWCGAEQQQPGTSRWRTLLWRLFGRHEGWNARDLQPVPFTWLQRPGGPRYMKGAR